MKFLALNPREKFNEPHVMINVTSGSKGWGKALSPFLLGPVVTLNGPALTVENAYQYSKIYEKHLDPSTGQPKDAYWEWRARGFESSRADRYPFGKENSHYVRGLWLGKQGEPGQLLNYVQGRKAIYVPAYQQALRNSRVYPMFLKFIADAYYTDTNLVFQDFDVFNHHAAGLILPQILNDPEKKYGHGFILVDEAQRFINSDSIDFAELEIINPSISSVNASLMSEGGPSTDTL